MLYRKDGKMDLWLPALVAVLIILATIFVTFRLIDQSQQHVDAVKEMDVKLDDRPSWALNDVDASVRIIRDDVTSGRKKNLEYNQMPLNEECFRLIGTMREIRHLDLPGCTMKGAWLKHIVHVPLSRLNITGADLRDGGIEHIARMARLNSLSLDDTRIGDSELAQLTDLKELRALSLRGTKVTDKSIEVIRQFPHLTSLAVTGTQIDDDGLIAISKIPRIVDLKISNLKISAKGLSSIAKMKALTHLSVSTCELSDADLNVLKTAAGLRHLAVDGNPISDQGLLSFSGMQNLKSISLEDCSRLTADGISKFEKARPEVKIKRSNLRSDLERYLPYDSALKELSPYLP